MKENKCFFFQGRKFSSEVPDKWIVAQRLKEVFCRVGSKLRIKVALAFGLPKIGSILVPILKGFVSEPFAPTRLDYYFQVRKFSA